MFLFSRVVNSPRPYLLAGEAVFGLFLASILRIGAADAEQSAAVAHDPYGALELVFSRAGAGEQRAPVAHKVDPWAIADMFIAPTAVPSNLASSFDRTAWSMNNGFIEPRVPQARAQTGEKPWHAEEQKPAWHAEGQKPGWHAEGHDNQPPGVAQQGLARDRKPGAIDQAPSRYRRVSTKPKPGHEGARWVPLPSILKPTSVPALR